MSASLGLSPNVSHLALFFPKQFTVGVLNAVLSVSALAGMLCPRLWSRLPLVSGFVSQLVSGLGCCVRLPSLVLLLPPNLSPIWAGLLRSLVSGLVSQQVSGLGCCVRLLGLVLLVLVSRFVSQLLGLWSGNAVSVLSCSYLPTCFPSWLGCCVRLPGLILVLSPLAFVSQLVSGLGCCALVLSCSCLRSCLPACLRSGMLCPSPCSLLSRSGMLCPPPWSCLVLVSRFVSQLLGLWSGNAVSVLSCSYLPTCFPSWLGCCVRLPGLILVLSPLAFVSQLVSGLGCCALVLSCSCLRSCLPACLRSGMLCPSPCSLLSGLVSQQVSGLGCCVRLLGLVLFLSPVLSPSFLAFGLVMLCPSCFALISQLVSHLGWGAVSASLVSSWSCLRLLLCLNLSPVWDAVP